MKAILSILLLISCITCKAQRGKFVAKKDTAYVVVVTGQSNAGSHGENPFIRPSINYAGVGKVYDWNESTKRFQAFDRATALSTGFESITSSNLGVLKAKKIYVVNINLGSTPISAWASPSGDLWVRLKAAIDTVTKRLDSLNLYPKVYSTIWLQGEANANLGTSEASYQSSLETFITNYRAINANVSQSQFVMMQLRTDYLDGSPTNVNNAIQNILSTRANTAVINPNSIGATYVDGAHYTAAGYVAIGTAWFNLIP